MISFVGAGPGDVNLITVKGRRLLEEADVVIYTGSLVSKEHLTFCKKGCVFYNSASMTLEEIIEVMEREALKGKNIVRLHTGDPSIYGAIKVGLISKTKMFYIRSVDLRSYQGADGSAGAKGPRIPGGAWCQFLYSQLCGDQK